MSIAIADYGLEQTTAPTQDPVSLEEAKAWLREDEELEEDRIRSLAKASTAWCEMFTGRQFVTATWTLKQATLSGKIELPKPPLQSITSISYIDTSDASQTVASSVYTAITDVSPGRVQEAADQTWPSAIRGEDEDVTIVYVAGYGAPSAVPDGIKTAVLALMAHWFEMRTPVVMGTTVASVPMSVKALLYSFRVRDFA